MTEAPNSLINRIGTSGNYLGTIIERLYRVKVTLVDMLEERGYKIPENEQLMFIENAPAASEEIDYMSSYSEALQAFAEYYYNLAIQGGISFHRALNSVYMETDKSVRFLNAAYEYALNLDKQKNADLGAIDPPLLIEPTFRRLSVYFTEPVVEGGKFKAANTDTVRAVSADMANSNITDGIVVAVKGFGYQARNEARRVVPGLMLFDYDQLNKSIIRHSLQPLFQHLTILERNEELLRSGIKLSQLPRMSEEDPVARFYGAPVGDVFRISRQKPVGRETSYRIVMPTPLAPKNGVSIKDAAQIFS